MHWCLNRLSTSAALLTWGPGSHTCYSGDLINDEDNQFSHCKAQAGNQPECRRNPLFAPFYSQAAKQSAMERDWWGNLHFEVASKPVKHQQECTGLLDILGWWSLKSSLLTESPSGNWSMVRIWGQKTRVLCSGSTTSALRTTQPAISSPDHRLLVGLQLCFLKRCSQS